MIKEEAIEILSDMRAEYNIFSDDEEEATRHHALSWAIQALNEQQPKQKWIPCSERLPKEDGYYLVTNSKWGAPWREITLWMTDGWSSDNKPIAWMPLPDPWKGEDNGDGQ